MPWKPEVYAQATVKVVFCTSCKGRVQHIEQTLPKNLSDNNGPCKFVLLDYNSNDHLNAYLGENHQKDIDSGKLVVYHFREGGPFRMAHSKNMTHRLGILEGADVLVNLDADNLTGLDFDSYAADTLGEHPDQFLWPNLPELKAANPAHSFKGINGRMGVTRNAFLKAGGYDERYRTWSPDDKDFDARLRRLGYKRRDIPHQFLTVLTHTDKLRFREYQHARTGVGEEGHAIIESPDHTVVNSGHFGMGEVFRNDLDFPVRLGPVPTRIFGIGWHKTATTSLSEALRMLGFESAHWKNAHWAKAIWEEMHKFGKSLTLEKSYALCDNPIAPLFRMLDLAYPGSKFILTVRDPARWLASVYNHWSHDKNPFRSAWDNDPFSHKLHQVLYGRRDFDATTFLNRYLRHNQEVVNYFRHRSPDLLVMDMDGGDGWPELCGFLGQRCPSVPYPRKFVNHGA